MSKVQYGQWSVDNSDQPHAETLDGNSHTQLFPVSHLLHNQAPMSSVMAFTWQWRSQRQGRDRRLSAEKSSSQKQAPKAEGEGPPLF